MHLLKFLVFCFLFLIKKTASFEHYGKVHESQDEFNLLNAIHEKKVYKAAEEKFDFQPDGYNVVFLVGLLRHGARAPFVYNEYLANATDFNDVHTAQLTALGAKQSKSAGKEIRDFILSLNKYDNCHDQNNDISKTEKKTYETDGTYNEVRQKDIGENAKSGNNLINNLRGGRENRSNNTSNSLYDFLHVNKEKMYNDNNYATMNNNSKYASNSSFPSCPSEHSVFMHLLFSKDVEDSLAGILKKQKTQLSEEIYIRASRKPRTHVTAKAYIEGLYDMDDWSLVNMEELQKQEGVYDAADIDTTSPIFIYPTTNLSSSFLQLNEITFSPSVASSFNFVDNTNNSTSFLPSISTDVSPSNISVGNSSLSPPSLSSSPSPLSNNKSIGGTSVEEGRVETSDILYIHSSVRDSQYYERDMRLNCLAVSMGLNFRMRLSENEYTNDYYKKLCAMTKQKATNVYIDMPDTYLALLESGVRTPFTRLQEIWGKEEYDAYVHTMRYHVGYFYANDTVAETASSGFFAMTNAIFNVKSSARKSDYANLKKLGDLLGGFNELVNDIYLNEYEINEEENKKNDILSSHKLIRKSNEEKNNNNNYSEGDQTVKENEEKTANMNSIDENSSNDDNTHNNIHNKNNKQKYKIDKLRFLLFVLSDYNVLSVLKVLGVYGGGVITFASRIYIQFLHKKRISADRQEEMHSDRNTSNYNSNDNHRENEEKEEAYYVRLLYSDPYTKMIAIILPFCGNKSICPFTVWKKFVQDKIKDVSFDNC